MTPLSNTGIYSLSRTIVTYYKQVTCRGRKEKKKNCIFLFICERKTVSTVEEKVKQNLHLVWYFDMNLSDFYSYSLIGKLTAFLQLQEFRQLKHNVSCSTSAVRRSHISSREKLVWLSLRQQPYVLILT